MEKEKMKKLIEQYYGVDCKMLNCTTGFNDEKIISRFESGYSVTTDLKSGKTGVFDQNDVLKTVFENLTPGEYCKLLYDVRNLKTV